MVGPRPGPGVRLFCGFSLLLVGSAARSRPGSEPELLSDYKKTDGVGGYSQAMSQMKGCRSSGYSIGKI